MMKKIICYLLTLTMILSCGVIASANDSDVIKIEAESCTNYSDTTSGNMYAPGVSGSDVDVRDGIVSFDQNEWMEYSIEVPQTGLYALSIYVGTRNESTVLTVTVGEKQLYSNNLASTGNMNTLTEMSISNLPLEAGENAIRFAVSGRVCNFDYFTLTYVGEAMTMLENENVFEAESADELTSETVEEDGKTAVVFTNGAKESYTLGAYSTKVYKVKLLAKGNALLTFYMNDDEIISKEINSDDYEVVDFGNIIFYEGKNVISLEASRGTLSLDNIEIKFVDPEGEQSSEDIIIQAEDYVRSEGSLTSGVSNGQKYISFNSGRIMEYDITIEKTGLYQVVVYSAIGPEYGYDEANIEITIGEDKASGTSYKTANWADWQPFTLCGMFVNTGETTFKVKGTSGASHINYFALKYVGKGINLDYISAEDEVLATNSHISKGTDCIKATFNVAPLISTVNEDNIKITANGENIPLAFDVEDRDVYISLLKSIEADAKVDVSFSDVMDGTKKSVMEDVSYTIYADAEDVGFSTLSEVVATNDYEDIEVTGYLHSKTGYKMEGRYIDMYIVYPDGTESEKILTVYSEKEGAFKINYTLPENSVDGVYKVRLYPEYAEDYAEASIGYMKKTSEKAMLDSLSETETLEDAKAIIEENARVLGLDLESDLSPMDIPDTDAFYAHFEGADFDTKEDLIKAYKSYVLLERINQASSDFIVETIINDEEALNLLGINAERISYVEENRQKMIEEIYELDSISSLDDFALACLEIIEKNIALETGAKEGILSLEDITVAQSGGITLDLSLEEGYNEVKEAVFEITYDKDEFESARAEAVGNNEVEISETENGIKVTVKVKWTLGETKDFAKVYLTAPKTTGDYNINVKGNVSLDKKYYPQGSSEISTLDILAYVKPVDVEVTVKKASNSGSSSNSGKSHTSSGGGGSSKPVTKPVETPTQAPTETPTEAPVEDTKVFKDLESVKWAEESIYSLLEKGVISKAEEFNPLNNVKREEFVKMLVVAIGAYDENAEADFADVNEGAWYDSYIGSAQKAGIVKGDDSGNFGIGNEISRQDMAVMIMRAFNLSGESNKENGFADDSEISDYAKDAVYMMKNLGIINGVGDNSFAPQMSANRAMAAKIINSVLVMEVTE